MTTEQDEMETPEASSIATTRFTRLVGAAGILSALTIVVIFATMILMPSPEAATTAGKLAHLHAHASTYQLANGLYPLLHLFLIVFFVGFSQLVSEDRLSRFALVAAMLGIVFFLVTALVYDARIALASVYATGSETTSQTIVSLVPVVERIQLTTGLAGHFFAWGLGVGAFSVAILRTPILSRWHGWLGLVFAVLAWGNLLRLVSDTFGPMLLVMDLVGIVWLVATGVSLVRLDPERLDAASWGSRTRTDDESSIDAAGSDM